MLLGPLGARARKTPEEQHPSDPSDERESDDGEGCGPTIVVDSHGVPLPTTPKLEINIPADRGRAARRMTQADAVIRFVAPSRPLT